MRSRVVLLPAGSVAALAMAITSCAEPAPSAVEVAPSPIVSVWHDHGWRVVELRDGTRCVAYYGGGTDCEWGNLPAEAAP